MALLGKTGSPQDGILTPAQQAALDARQELAAQAVESYWLRNPSTHVHPALALPTGIGKGRIAHRIMQGSAHEAIVLIVGTRNALLRQNYDMLTALVEEATGDREFTVLPDTSGRVVMATWQGLAAYLRKNDRPPSFGLAVIDEAHNTGTRKRLMMLGDLAPDHVVGMTATIYRSSGAYRAPEEYSFCVVDSMSLPDAVRNYWLSPLAGLSIDLRVTLPKEVREGMELNMGKLRRALRAYPDLFPSIARDIAKRALSRQYKTIIAVNRVEEAVGAARELKRLGYRPGLAINRADAIRLSGEFVTLDSIERYKLPYEEPEAVDALVSPFAIGEGFDAPVTECIAWAAPTLSATRYTQMVGRGARRFAGKAFCLVLDYLYVIQDFGYSYNFAQFLLEEDLLELEGGVLWLGPATAIRPPVPRDISEGAVTVPVIKMRESGYLPSGDWRTASALAAEIGMSDTWVYRKLVQYKDMARDRIDPHGRLYLHYPPEVAKVVREEAERVPQANGWLNAADIAKMIGSSHTWVVSRLGPYEKESEYRRDQTGRASRHYRKRVAVLLRREWRSKSEAVSADRENGQEITVNRRTYSLSQFARAVGVPKSTAKNLLKPYRQMAEVRAHGATLRTRYPDKVLELVMRMLTGQISMEGRWYTKAQIAQELGVVESRLDRPLGRFTIPSMLRRKGGRPVEPRYPEQVVEFLREKQENNRKRLGS